MSDPETTRQDAEGSGIAQADRGGKAEVNVYHGVPAERVAEMLFEAKGQRGEAIPAIHLPQRKALFIGREAEIEALRRQLREPGSLAYLCGVAGCGKTALALEYAHRARSDFESVHWLPCEKRSLVQIAGELAFQLGLQPDGELETMMRELKGQCAQKRRLLVFDNVDDETPARLLSGGRTSALITTRYNNLRFLRSYQPVTLPLFTEEQCFELFREKIGEAEVDKHAADARLLFQRLGYLPIGISVAAGLVHEDVRYTIDGMAKNLPADAYALLQESAAALSPPAQTLLAAMAVCAPEGFRLSLAAGIAEFEEAPSLDALQEIYSRSLTEELDRSARRYRLHAMVRKAAGATDLQRQRHAELVQSEFKLWATDWRKCEADMADWQAAFAWLLGQSDDRAWAAAATLADDGNFLMRRVGRLTEAYEIYERLQREAERRNAVQVLQAIYGNQALILQDWGRLEEAMALHKKQEEICRASGNDDSLQACYGNQALILRAWGKLTDAMTLLKKQEDICVKLNNLDGLQTSYGNQATILQDWGRLDEAMTLYENQEAICVQRGDQDGLQRNYGNRALILQKRGLLKEAMDLHKKKEAICLDLGNQDSLQKCYGNQALILKQWGKLDEAMKLHAKEEAICDTLGNREGLQRSYGNQALILQLRGKLEEAMTFQEKREAICIELGNKSSLAHCYWNQGLLARDQGDLKTKQKKLDHALALFTELNMPLEVKAVQNALDETHGNAAMSSTSSFQVEPASQITE